MREPEAHPWGTQSAIRQRQDERAAWEAYAVGMAFNAASLAIASPYIVNLLAVLLSGFAIVRWRQRRLALTALVCTLAANPANAWATLPCNVVLAGGLALTRSFTLERLPKWLILATGLGLASAVASIPSWDMKLTLEVTFTQTAAVLNYIVVPLLLIPAFFHGLTHVADARTLARGLVIWLLVPTLLFLTAARATGEPVSDVTLNMYDYELYGLYRLGQVVVVLIRTQVGIVLAAIGSVLFTYIILRLSAWWRAAAAAGMTVTVALMLMTGSVGSATALAAGMAASMLRAGRRIGFIATAAIGAMALGVFTMAEQWLPQDLFAYVTGRYKERFETGRGIGAADRYERWVSAANYALDNPSGVGWSLYVRAIDTHPHNDYLSYAIAWGALCGAAYFAAVGLLWWQFVAQRRQNVDEYRLALATAGIGVVTVLAVNSMADHLTANRWYFNVVWSIAWYCLFASAAPRRMTHEAPAST